MSSVTSGLERRDSIDALAASLMILLTFSWGLNQVAIKIATPATIPCS